MSAGSASELGMRDASDPSHCSLAPTDSTPGAETMGETGFLAVAVEPTPATARTPSPSEVHTPPAPRYGFHDSWGPRKSARISAAQRDENPATPSHGPPAVKRAAAAAASAAVAKSPRVIKKSTSSAVVTAAALVSPIASPQKKRVAPSPVTSRTSGLLTAESAAHAASALGLDADDDAGDDVGGDHEPTSSLSGPSVTTRRAAALAGMLPTPAKTPQHRCTDKTAAKIERVARNLFHDDEDIMPSPKRRGGKKYEAVSLGSFTAVEEDHEEIEIFTDSRERIPEKDDSADNPFYGTSARPEPTRKRRTRKVMIPGEGAQDVEEAVKRDDGIVYVFRGKRYFRHFGADDDEVEEIGEDNGDRAESSVRHLTRSQIKPRLLFPTGDNKSMMGKSQAVLDEEEAPTDREDDADLDQMEEPEESDPEEAATDIEEEEEQKEQQQLPQLVEVPSTPRAQKKASTMAPITPDAPRFGLTPPPTKRITRSMKLAVGDHDGLALPVAGHPAPPPPRRPSPFDSWRITKGSRSSSSSSRGGGQGPASPSRSLRKRSGDHLSAAETKRARV